MMNIDFELYRIFYEVASVKNITKASEKLLISQPAISKSIKNLETQLGGQLFVRTKKGVTLTEEGKIFYDYIKQAIEYINNAESKFTNLIKLECGTIRIGINTTLAKEFLIHYIKIFHELHPKINIQIITGLTTSLITQLKAGLIDIVVLNLPFDTDKDIKLIPCKKIQDVFIVSKKYKGLCNKVMELKELNNYPLILQDEKSNTRKFLDDFCKKNNLCLKPEMTLASYSLVTEFTKIGLGVGYATKEYVQHEIKNKKLYVLNVKPKIPKREIGIAYSQKNIPSFVTKELIKVIINN